MTARLLILALGALAAYGGEATVIGTIQSVAANQIQVKTRTKVASVLVEEGTIVRGPSPLKAGNEVSIRCQPNGSGTLVAVKIWASVVAFSATVKHVDGDDIEVITSSQSGSQREEHKIVHVHPDTAFSTNRKDLTVGQSVRVVGLDVGDGAVDAARIAIYNTDMPARQ